MQFTIHRSPFTINSMSDEITPARLNAHAQRLLKTHETLLRDTRRNAAFYKALEKTVKPGDVVLDIGAGTGIWAIAAAKLGAKRVVAIDADEMMIGVIKMLASEHGVSNRVDAIWGTSFEVSLEREFDVVVSETIGYLGYDERIVEVMHDARKRFLKDGGKIIPETISLHAAAGIIKVRQNVIPESVPFAFDTLAKLNRNSPRVLKKAADMQLLTEPVCLVKTDLRTAEAPPSLDNLKASWDIADAADVNCIALWAESRLVSGVSLSTRRTTSWRPTIFAVEPAGDQRAGLEFTLSLTPENSSWTVNFVGDGKAVTREYSLASAATKMQAAARHGNENRDVLLRAATEEMREFLFSVYAMSRADEVAMFGWDAAQTDAFLRMQFDIRERAYAAQFPAAITSVIVFNGHDAGSTIVNTGDDAITLVDIGVSPGYRRHGLASHVLRSLQETASAKKIPVALHVERLNERAFRLYKKHGFSVTAESALYYEMEWTPK